MTTSFRENITAARIDALLREAADTPTGLFLWDTKLRGFGLRASPVNRKGQQKASWIVQRWSAKLNRVERVVFGEYPDMSVAAARKEAEQRRGSKEALGAEKQQDIANAKNTLGGAVETYLAERPLQKDKPLRARYWHETRQMLERDLVAKLGKNKPVASIGLQDVRGLIKAKQLAGQKAMARALLAAVRPFFKWCVAEGLISVSPLAAYSDAPKPVAKRKRTLSDAEVKALWKATEAVGAWNSFYRLLLLTAQRREEVAGIRRSELDLDAGLWTIPGERTKNGEEHVVHLSPLALEVIRSCPSEGDYLFPATALFIAKDKLKRPTISGYSKAKAALDKRMPKGTPEWNIHDLRRTAATWMDGAGFETNIIEWVLNHVSGTRGGLVGTYQRHPHLQERKLAIEAWNKHVGDLAAETDTSKSNVISFGKAS